MHGWLALQEHQQLVRDLAGGVPAHLVCLAEVKLDQPAVHIKVHSLHRDPRIVFGQLAGGGKANPGKPTSQRYTFSPQPALRSRGTVVLVLKELVPYPAGRRGGG